MKTKVTKFGYSVKTGSISHTGFRATKKEKKTTISDYTATGIAEGFIECNNDDKKIEAWQHLHDTGLAYTLQGWFGRTARNLLANGIINL